MIRIENPELLHVFSLKPGVDQNITLHALPAARNSAFLICTIPVHFTSFFSTILFKHKVARCITINHTFAGDFHEMCFAMS